MAALFWSLASFLYYKVAFAATFQSISIIAALLLALMVGIAIHYLTYWLALVQGRHLALVTLGRAQSFPKFSVFILGMSALFAVIVGKLIIYGFSEKLSRLISGRDILYDLGSSWKTEQALTCMALLAAPLILHGMTCLYAVLVSGKHAHLQRDTFNPAAPKSDSVVSEWEKLPNEPWKKMRRHGELLSAAEQKPPIIVEEARSESITAGGKAFLAKTDAAGTLTFSLYDCSDAAQEWVGNDVASHIMIEGTHQTAFLCRVLGVSIEELSTLAATNLLSRVASRFGTLSALEIWLNAELFPYSEIIDNWA